MSNMGQVPGPSTSSNQTLCPHVKGMFDKFSSCQLKNKLLNDFFKCMYVTLPLNERI